MAAKTNVVPRNTSTLIPWTSAFLFFFVFQQCVAVEDCDFRKCVISSRSFISELRKDGTPFHCRNFTSLSGCSDYCMHKYYPSIFSHSDRNQPPIGEFCVQNLANRSNVSWSCIARHTFRLLTCLANISSLTSNNVHGDAIMKESCRKSVEFSECPSKVLLPECGENSVDAVKEILQFAVDYFMPSSCKNINIKHIRTMSVNYSHGKEFMELAKCFDRLLVDIDACFRQVIQNERDLHEFVCGHDALGSCIEFLVSKSCTGKAVLELYVRKLLLKLFSFAGIRCENSQFEFKYLRTSQDYPVTNGKMDKPSQQPPLNDDIHTPDPLLLEIPTFQVTETKQLFHHKNTTSDTKYNLDHNVNVNKLFEEKGSDVRNINGSSHFTFEKVHTGDSSVENHSENPSHKDRDHFKASKGSYLLCDKAIYCVTFLIIILTCLFG